VVNFSVSVRPQTGQELC